MQVLMILPYIACNMQNMQKKYALYAKYANVIFKIQNMHCTLLLMGDTATFEPARLGGPGLGPPGASGGPPSESRACTKLEVAATASPMLGRAVPVIESSFKLPGNHDVTVLGTFIFKFKLPGHPNQRPRCHSPIYPRPSRRVLSYRDCTRTVAIHDYFQSVATPGPRARAMHNTNQRSAPHACRGFTVKAIHY
jgi:hypothetical protein